MTQARSPLAIRHHGQPCDIRRSPRTRPSDPRCSTDTAGAEQRDLLSGQHSPGAPPRLGTHHERAVVGERERNVLKRVRGDDPRGHAVAADRGRQGGRRTAPLTPGPADAVRASEPHVVHLRLVHLRRPPPAVVAVDDEHPSLDGAVALGWEQWRAVVADQRQPGPRRTPRVDGSGGAKIDTKRAKSEIQLRLTPVDGDGRSRASATDPAARAGARSCTACSERSATSAPPSAPSRPAPRPPEQRQCMPTSTTTRRPLGLGGPDPSALEAVYRLQDPRSADCRSFCSKLWTLACETRTPVSSAVASPRLPWGLGVGRMGE
jgi:hypothetical protein